MRPIHFLLSIAVLVAPLTADVSLAGNAVLYVVDRPDDEPSATACLPATPGDCSLRGAFIRANQDSSDSVISLPDGLYKLTVEGSEEDLALTGDLDIVRDDLRLQALPGAHPTIHQVTQDRIFDIRSTAKNVTFIGPITLLGGEAFATNSAHRGGSIHFLGADSLTLEDIHMIGGFAADTGGCLDWTATALPIGFLRLTDVTFTGCETEGNGGAFRIFGSSQPIQLDRITATQNIAGATGGGGRIDAIDGTALIDSSTFAHNTVEISIDQGLLGGGQFLAGGGLYLGPGAYSIVDSTIARNTVGQTGVLSSRGGGIAFDNAQATLRNSTVSENRGLSGSHDGADLSMAQSDVDLQFVTLRAHQPVQTRSVHAFGTSTLDIFASVIEGECDAPGAISSLGLNVEAPPGGAQSTQCDLNHVSDLLVASSVLKPLAGYGGPTPTHALAPASAPTAFNVPSASCPDTDQRGAERLSLFCHSGAYEANASPPGPWIFSDGFESGTTAAWSASQP